MMMMVYVVRGRLYPDCLLFIIVFNIFVAKKASTVMMMLMVYAVRGRLFPDCHRLAHVSPFMSMNMLQFMQ